MRLTFEQGFFTLHLDQFEKLPRLELWEQIDPKTYRTRYVKAARRFRERADDKARKIFEKVFVKFFPEPDVSRLTFLDPHQLAGVRHVLTRSRSYLAHAPGAGKTAQAICAATLVDLPAPVLFIVPPGLTTNWGREIERFSELAGRPLSFTIIGRTEDQAEVDWTAEVIVCPDSMLQRNWVLERLVKMRFRLLAVDEASRFKEPTSKRSVALFGGRSGGFSSPGLIYRARHAVLMDGSPMPNRPMELWGPTFAMAPETIDFMERHDFGLRYCGPIVNDFGQFEFRYSSNERELHEKLTKDFMHVVSESELKHPERLRSILFMSKDLRTKEEAAWEQANLNGIDFGAIDDDIKNEELSAWRRKLGLRKVPWAAEYIESRLKEKNESLLVFAWHREVCEALAERLELYGAKLVIGGTPNEVREKYFRDFQIGTCRIIIGNISAMGRGHNLQNADRIIFVESSWSNETNLQAEKRASRRGSTKDFVRCEYICAPNSIDELVLGSLFRKDKSVKKIIGG